MYRKDKIQNASNETFDVAIIGGGITGAGIFLRCCEQGLKTILVDQSDFAAGTSSRSAKMIHGGLRYLEHFQVKLVKEALTEREHLLNNYPHLVRPLPFLMPIYGSAFDLMKMKVGLTGYDALAGSSKLPKHKSFGKREILKKYPMLRGKGLKGGIYYYDALTNDALLTNEVIMQACNLGGVALNYMDVEEIDISDTTVETLSCRDGLSGEEVKVSAKHFISAAGIWTDEVVAKAGAERESIMKPSKGIHLVLDGERFPPEDVLIIPTSDDRFLWICPWLEGLVLIGTTDTAFEGDLGEPGCTDHDIDYILSNINNYLDGIQLTREDILSAFSGLRPLLNEEGAENTSKMSRDYKIWWKNENLLVIAGGKLTSFLSMADKVVEKLAERSDKLFDIQPPETKIAADSLKEYLDKEGSTDLETRIRFFVTHQHAEKIEDVLTRRLIASYRMRALDNDLVKSVADVMAEELNWSDETKSSRIEDYRKHWEHMHPHIK
ncbi:MAG: glycerol-3-phosphate dehydrogenase/oxidase [Bacteroidetes bacterium]|nr:glycerol-3-phosphate dehydrogenase/oxidase [Bacteroidota bacterium]